MNVWKYLSLILIGLLTITLTSCGGSSDGGGSKGKLSLSLSDATTSDYQAVYVTIAQIQVHRADAEDDALEQGNGESAVQAAGGVAEGQECKQ